MGRTQHVSRNGKLMGRLAFFENVGASIYTPDGSLIVAVNGSGLLRFSPQVLADLSPTKQQIHDETYDHTFGLSGDDVRALLLDADGNLWVGGQRGLDRFRQARLVPFAPVYSGDTYLCAGSRGEVWIASPGATKNEIYKVAGGVTQLLPDVGESYGIFCPPNGDTWLVSHKGIFRYRADRLTSIPAVPGTHPFDVQQIVATPDQVLFASVRGESGVTGIWRYRNKAWTKLSGSGLFSSAPLTEYLDSRGRLLTGYTDGRIASPLEDGGRVYSSGNPGLGAVYAILETTRGLFAGGTNGLAVLRSGRFEMLKFANPDAAQGVGGVLESANGDLWLNALHGIVYISATELQAALTDPNHSMKSKILTEGNFVGPVELKSGMASTARDGAGRLWFASLNGLFHIDPGQEVSTGHPPILSIRSVTADGKAVGIAVDVAPGLQILEFQYFGVNLTAPEQVTYRYKLEGLEASWQEAGHRTGAIYSRLPPGTFVFRVEASNDGRSWTAPVASQVITVLPHYYQTRWFFTLCGFAVLLLIWLFYAMRIRIISREIRTRAEERADERIRIARDLHDTMLQGIQGLLLTVHVAAQKASKGEDSARLLDKALTTAERVVIEGRNRGQQFALGASDGWGAGGRD